MELICTYCKKPYNVNPAEAASAVIDYTFGKKTHTFICDNCGKENAVTKATYEAAKAAAEKPKPAAGAGAKPVAKPAAKPVVKPAPKPVIKPAPKPAPSPIQFEPKREAPAKKRTAVVTTYSLHVRKDHSTRAETMAGLSKGDKVEVITTWTDGKNVWAQIGPERWAAMVYNGDTLMEFTS